MHPRSMSVSSVRCLLLYNGKSISCTSKTAVQNQKHEILGVNNTHRSHASRHPRSWGHLCEPTSLRLMMRLRCVAVALYLALRAPSACANWARHHADDISALKRAACEQPIRTDKMASATTKKGEVMPSHQYELMYGMFLMPLQNQALVWP